MSNVRRTKWVSVLAALSLSVLTVGCAITDYVPGQGHRTAVEAKLRNTEIAFGNVGGLSGTYSYTVDYDNRSNTGVPGLPPDNIVINTYRNPVFAAFNRDGSVNRDGSDLQGRKGHIGLPPFPANPAGTWNRTFIANDQAPGCQFFANVTFGAPVIAACFLGPAEEIDNLDVDLQASFSSFDELLGAIWRGAFTESEGITLDVIGVRFDGELAPIGQPVSIEMRHNGFRPDGFSVVASAAAMSELVQLVKTHTGHLQPVTLGLSCAGGLEFDFPSKLVFAFDHTALDKLNIGAAPTEGL